MMVPKCKKCGKFLERVLVEDSFEPEWSCPNSCPDALPNSGVKRIIGGYEIKINLFPGQRLGRTISILNGTVSGNFIFDLFRKIESDLNVLEEAALNMEDVIEGGR